MYIINSTYTSKIYSDFIFNYIKNRERTKMDNSKPRGSQGLMSIQETLGQAWVTESESQMNRPRYLILGGGGGGRVCCDTAAMCLALLRHFPYTASDREILCWNSKDNSRVLNRKLVASQKSFSHHRQGNCSLDSACMYSYTRRKTLLYVVIHKHHGVFWGDQPCRYWSKNQTL
jgi:hypothetical protein